jgi:release factor glutamine methyltransferase
MLVDFAIERLRSGDPEGRPPVIVDIGTGSGCIAVAVLASDARARAIATDVSAQALATARRNASRHSVSERLGLARCDLASAIRPACADLVLSNPPYIAEGEIVDLQPEVRDYEPRLALSGGKDGLETIRRLIGSAGRALRAGGWLAMETGLGQARDVAALLTASGYAAVEIRADLANIERVVIGRLAATEEDEHDS